MSLAGGDPRAFNAAWKAQEARERRKREQEAIDKRLADLGESLRKLREEGERTFQRSKGPPSPPETTS
jgi:hypothetical protein